MGMLKSKSDTFERSENVSIGIQTAFNYARIKIEGKDIERSLKP